MWRRGQWLTFSAGTHRWFIARGERAGGVIAGKGTIWSSDHALVSEVRAVFSS